MTVEDHAEPRHIEHICIEKLGNSNEVFCPSHPQANRDDMFGAQNSSSNRFGSLIDVHVPCFCKGFRIEVVGHRDELNRPTLDYNPSFLKVRVPPFLQVQKYWRQRS